MQNNKKSIYNKKIYNSIFLMQLYLASAMFEKMIEENLSLFNYDLSF